LIFIFAFFRNDFLENSRYAKIAYQVATTMETVNLNEITTSQALAHFVNNLSIKKKVLMAFLFS
jgi:hypothetical protein